MNVTVCEASHGGTGGESFPLWALLGDDRRHMGLNARAARGATSSPTPARRTGSKLGRRRPRQVERGSPSPRRSGGHAVWSHRGTRRSRRVVPLGMSSPRECIGSGVGAHRDALALPRSARAGAFHPRLGPWDYRLHEWHRDARRDARPGQRGLRPAVVGSCARALRGRCRRASAGSGGPRAFRQGGLLGGGRGRCDLGPGGRVRSLPSPRRQRASRLLRAHPPAPARLDAPGLARGGVVDAGRAPASGRRRVHGPRLPRDRPRRWGSGTWGPRRGTHPGRARRSDREPVRRPRPSDMGPHASGHVPGGRGPGRRGVAADGAGRLGSGGRRARHVHHRGSPDQRREHVPRPGRLSPRQRVVRRRDALVRATAHQGLPRGLSGQPCGDPPHAREVARGRGGSPLRLAGVEGVQPGPRGGCSARAG